MCETTNSNPSWKDGIAKAKSNPSDKQGAPRIGVARRAYPNHYSREFFMTVSTNTIARIELAKASESRSFGYENPFSVRTYNFSGALANLLECKDSNLIEGLEAKAKQALGEVPEAAWDYLRENVDYQRIAVLWVHSNTLTPEGDPGYDPDAIQHVGDYDSDTAWGESKEALTQLENGALRDANLFAWKHYTDLLDDFAGEAEAKEREKATDGEASAFSTGKELLDTMAEVVGVAYGEPDKADAWHSFRGAMIDLAPEAVADALVAFPPENDNDGGASLFLCELSDAHGDIERGLSAGWNELCFRFRDNDGLADLRAFFVARYGASVVA